MNQLGEDNRSARSESLTVALVLVFVAVMLLCAGCSPGADWPPPPRNKQEKLVLEAALRAVDQYDGWAEVACVIERAGPEWNVQAWKIVHPQARGRQKCVPWAVRTITLDRHAAVTGYKNSR